MILYLETSAAAKLLVEEAESAALSDYLDSAADGGDMVVSSVLTETELRRLAIRHDLDQAAVSELLDRLDLIEPGRAIFTEAGLLPGVNLRSLDALHVAMALRAEADCLIAYDQRQCDAARAVGLDVIAPR